MKTYNREIEELYLRMYDFLLDYAKASLDSYSLAEEAVQETFEIACKKAREVCDSKSPEGWLVNTIRHVISNMLRSRATANRILSEHLGSQDCKISITDERIRLEVMYEDISDMEEFKLLKELAVDGLSYAEMAEKRGITAIVCRKRVQRAKKALRKKFTE